MLVLVSNLKYLLKEMVVDETGLEQEEQEFDIDIDFAPMNSTDSISRRSSPRCSNSWA